jgi:hypothetical protein
MSYSSGTGGALLSGFPYNSSGLEGLTGWMEPDYSGHMWYVDGGDGEVGALNSNGGQYTTSGTLLGAANYLTPFDNIGGTLEIVATQGDGVENIQLVKLGPPPANGSVISSISTEQLPAATVVDGAGLIYFNNAGSSPENLTEITTGGAQVSPTGIGWTGGSGLEGAEGWINAAEGMGIDQSGNVWSLNNNNSQNKNTNKTYTNSNGIKYLYTGSACSTVTEFIGLAKPVDPVFATSAKVGATVGVTGAGAYGVAP